MLYSVMTSHGQQMDVGELVTCLYDMHARGQRLVSYHLIYREQLITH